MPENHVSIHLFFKLNERPCYFLVQVVEIVNENYLIVFANQQMMSVFMPKRLNWLFVCGVLDSITTHVNNSVNHLIHFLQTQLQYHVPRQPDFHPCATFVNALSKCFIQSFPGPNMRYHLHPKTVTLGMNCHLICKLVVNPGDTTIKAKLYAYVCQTIVGDEGNVIQIFSQL